MNGLNNSSPSQRRDDEDDDPNEDEVKDDLDLGRFVLISSLSFKASFSLNSSKSAKRLGVAEDEVDLRLFREEAEGGIVAGFKVDLKLESCCRVENLLDAILTVVLTSLLR